MSKNIIIQEGGVGKQLTVDKLETALVGEGDCLWVPEDSVSLIDKTITEDGTYYASSNGAYGYRSVTVRGIGVATGKDDDGDEVEAKPGPDGKIEVTKIPSSIKITTPPTKLEYMDGETIDFSGLVVKAMLKTGGIFTDETYPDGVIPTSELEFPVTVADRDSGVFTTPADDSSDIYRLYGITFSFEILPIGGVIYGNLENKTTSPQERTYTLTQADSDVYVVKYEPEGETTYAYVIVASSGPFTLHYIGPDSGIPMSHVTERDWHYSPLPPANIAYASIQCLRMWNSLFPWISVMDYYYTAKDMVRFGDGLPEQQIPVNWPCPYGEQITMTDSFAITFCTSSEAEGGYGGASGGGGQTGDIGAGRND